MAYTPHKQHASITRKHPYGLYPSRICLFEPIRDTERLKASERLICGKTRLSFLLDTKRQTAQELFFSRRLAREVVEKRQKWIE